MNRWLSNISVNLKLSLGFGLVLALTCVMAVCNWISLDKMIDRSNWMSDITRLNTAFTNLRVTRLQYMLTDGDETAAQNVQASIDAFSAQQSQLIATFQSPENLKLLKEQQEIIGRYERALVTMRKAYVESAVSRANMDRNAALAQDAITTLLNRALQLPAGDENRFAMFQTVSEVREQFLLSRYQVRAYIAAPNPATEKAARQQLDAAIASLDRLGSHFAANAGAGEAWMVEDGKVTEGTSSNAYIVKDGKVITRGLSNRILAGCTRKALMRLPWRTTHWTRPWRGDGTRSLSIQPGECTRRSL